MFLSIPPRHKQQVIVLNHTNPNGRIWLDGVRCVSETLPNLDRCQHSAYGTYACEAAEVAAVRCSGHAQQQPNNSRPTAAPAAHADASANDVQCGRIQRPADNAIADATATDDEVAAGGADADSGLRPAQRGHHPWQVSVRLLIDSTTHQHHCGGALLSRRHVLTAGHCVRTYDGTGWLAVQTGHGRDQQQPVAVRSKRAHPLFRDRRNWSAHQHDIALLWLVAAVDFGDLVRPVCLPPAAAATAAATTADTAAATPCTMAGWGRCPSGRRNANMLSARVRLLDDGRCGATEQHGTNVTVGMLCAEHVADLCAGFSGGPLVCGAEDGVHRVVGVFSWIADGKPAVFTKSSPTCSKVQNTLSIPFVNEGHREHRHERQTIQSTHDLHEAVFAAARNTIHLAAVLQLVGLRQWRRLSYE